MWYSAYNKLVINMLLPLGSKILYTKHYILRPFIYNDAQMMYFYLSDSEVCKYLEFNPVLNINQVYKEISVYLENYHNPFYFHWAIVDKTNGFVIGSTSIHNIDQYLQSGELGICLSRLYWRKGVGKEVLGKLMEFGVKEVGFKEFKAFYIEGNDASKYMLKGLGFNEKIKKERIFKKNGVNLIVKGLKIRYF